jgi:predicted N-acetyltransferase YhbS
MTKVHPTEPHWYLFAIGSDPTVRGAGFGQALMHSRIDRCHAAHAPAYREATKQETVPYYMRFGFEVTDEIEAPGDRALDVPDVAGACARGGEQSYDARQCW